MEQERLARKFAAWPTQLQCHVWHRFSHLKLDHCPGNQVRKMDLPVVGPLSSTTQCEVCSWFHLRAGKDAMTWWAAGDWCSSSVLKASWRQAGGASCRGTPGVDTVCLMNYRWAFAVAARCPQMAWLSLIEHIDLVFPTWQVTPLWIHPRPATNQRAPNKRSRLELDLPSYTTLCSKLSFAYISRLV